MEQHERSQEFNSLLKHLQGWDSDRLFAAQEAVEQLTRLPGWAVVVELSELLQASGMRSLKLANGRLQQGEYAALLGKLAGLEALPRIPEAVSLAAERAEERLEQANAETAGATA